MANDSVNDFEHNILEIKRKLEQIPFTRRRPIEGCSDLDVRMLEEYAGGRLPAAYVAFLKIYGRDTRRLFTGQSAALNDRYQLQMKELANRQLEGMNVPFRIGDSSFVFLELQGCIFWFFPLGESEDPPVYSIGDGDVEPLLMANSFTDFLVLRLREFEGIVERHPSVLDTL